MQENVHCFPLNHGLLSDHRTDRFPTRLAGWRDDELGLSGGETHFGFVQDGVAILECDSGTFGLVAGMYFSAPGACGVRGGSGIVMSRCEFLGFFQLGGPIEETGRLRYIDGCTDSLLVAPVVRGDPCLNLLHVPPGVRQTSHTHPSLRVGVIVSGSGRCVTPEGELALSPGTVFVIPAECEHAFHTAADSLRIVAFHPDSDTGPSHEDHPMLNRTHVEGEPIARLRERGREGCRR